MERDLRRAAFLFIIVAISISTNALVPTVAAARDPQAGIVDPDVNVVVGGEPGEDPHLKTTPTEPIKDYGDPPIGASVRCDGSGRNIYDWSGRGEGESRLGSRVGCWWRLILGMWLCTLQR